jgi:hypothetical protein
MKSLKLTPSIVAIAMLVLVATLAPTDAPRAAKPAGADSAAEYKPHSMMPTVAPIIIRGKEFTVRELIQRAMKGERTKLAGHANATYRIAAHVSVVWPEKKEVQTEVYRVYGDSTGYQRRILLAARNERYKKKEGEWVLDKNAKPDTDPYRVSDEEMSRFTRVPVYLEHDEEFDFALLERTLEGNHIVFHVAFKPKSSFSEMPGGDIWVDSNGFRVVHEIYDFAKNPFPMLIKGVRRISVQWTELAGGEWVPKQIAAEIELRRGVMPFMPSTVSFKQIWEDFRFDQGYDEKLFGKNAPAAVVASEKSGGATTNAAPPASTPATTPTTSATLPTSIPAPPAAADSFRVYVDSTGTIVSAPPGVVDSTAAGRATTADSSSSKAATSLLATLQEQDDAAYTSEVRITNRAFIDSTAARHDSLGVAGLGNDVPMYGDAWKLGFDPQVTHWDYNRVEGLVFGGAASFHRADEKSSLSGFGAYATASEKFRYHADLKTELPKTDHKLSLNLSFRDYVEPFGSNRITLNSLRAFIGGADEQDYLHRTGGAVSVAYRPVEDVSLDVGFEGARERSVGQEADFSFWGDMGKPNPAVDEGDEHAVVAGFHLEGRRWLNAQITQRLAGGSLGGDFRYARTDIMLRARGYVLGRQEFEATLQGVTTGDAPPFQRLADVGGLSTVRGYDRRTHVGNHSFAARVEYLFPYDLFASSHIPIVKDAGLQIIPWADAGRVGEGDSQGWITSVGVGLQRYLWPIEEAANLRLDFAWPQHDDFTVYLWFTALR